MRRVRPAMPMAQRLWVTANVAATLAVPLPVETGRSRPDCLVASIRTQSAARGLPVGRAATEITIEEL